MHKSDTCLFYTRCRDHSLLKKEAKNYYQLDQNQGCHLSRERLLNKSTSIPVLKSEIAR